MNHYQELREALGIPQETSHEDVLRFATTLRPHPVEYPQGLDGAEFAAAWHQWIAYRKERKLPSYKTIGLRAQFKRLAEMGVKRAVAAINYSITQNYQGIYEERQGSAQQNTRSTGTLNGTGRYNLGSGVHGGKRAETHDQIPPVG